ncbi:hypothetical protein EOM09_02630 [bacterium]|nr:hypothetical protein [bacterium]
MLNYSNYLNIKKQNMKNEYNIKIIKHFGNFIINMIVFTFLIIGMFYSTFYAHITLGKLDGSPIWFISSLMMIIVLSYNLLNNLILDQKELKKNRK